MTISPNDQKLEMKKGANRIIKLVLKWYTKSLGHKQVEL
jgi:hypothetical protein